MISLCPLRPGGLKIFEIIVLFFVRMKNLGRHFFEFIRNVRGIDIVARNVGHFIIFAADGFASI